MQKCSGSYSESFYWLRCFWDAVSLLKRQRLKSRTLSTQERRTDIGSWLIDKTSKVRYTYIRKARR